MVTVRQIKAARALADWSQRDLSRASGVSLPAIAKLEQNEGALGGKESTRAKILKAFEGVGIVFLNVAEQGVTLRRIRRRSKAAPEATQRARRLKHRGL
jgi:transcriptional regulator with XRE-family HTH domain